MVPNYSRIHRAFKLNNEKLDAHSLTELAYSYIKEGNLYQKHIGKFLLNWLDHTDYVLVNTSGSTGTPKEIQISKQAMMYSALATGSYFNAMEDTKALHCLPTEYIAGKMMIVRALVLGWELDVVAPRLSPLEGITKQYNFSAMVPLQMQNSIEALHHIDTLIVGGAVVTRTLQKQIQDCPCNIYATYGMTETITHIAVKRLNGSNPTNDFTILPDISITKDNRDCLVIEAPKLSEEVIVTNDVVALISDNTFKILGRIDNVINSGGVKLFPEQIEHKLQRLIEQRFFIASEKDDDLGECLILVIESENEIARLLEFIKNQGDLNKFEIPKHIYYTSQFAETGSGKIKRHKTLALLKK